MGRPFAIAGWTRGWMGWDEEESDASALCGFFFGLFSPCTHQPSVQRAAACRRRGGECPKLPPPASNRCSEPAAFGNDEAAAACWCRRDCCAVERAVESCSRAAESHWDALFVYIRP